MSFRIGSIYAEVGVSFPVSYKVDKLLIYKIQQSLPLKSQIVNRDGEDYSLGVVISTKSNVDSLLIQGPSISKRYKMIDYTLWIPYRQVVDDENPLKSYIDFVCQGIIVVLSKYDYDTQVILRVCEEVKEVVLGNSEYAFDDVDEEW